MLFLIVQISSNARSILVRRKELYTSRRTSSAGGMVSQTPATGCAATGTNFVDCMDTGLTVTNAFNAVTVTGSPSWVAGGVGPSGSDQFNVQEVFTYVPNLRPGATGFAVVARQRFDRFGAGWPSQVLNTFKCSLRGRCII